MENLAARLAIAEQLGRYCLAFDSHDAAAWASLFTDDGVFEVRLAGSAKPLFQARGTEQLRVFASHAPGVIHHITNLVFDAISLDSARTRATVLGTWSPGNDGPSIYTHGVYEQRWTLVAETWRLAYQLFLSHGYHPAAFA